MTEKTIKNFKFSKKGTLTSFWVIRRKNESTTRFLYNLAIK